MGRLAPAQATGYLLDNFADVLLGGVTTIHEVRNVLEGIGSELTMPILELTPLRLQAGDERPETGVGQVGEQLREVFIRRLAVFWRDRWVADFDPLLVQSFVLLTGDTRTGSITIANPADPGQYIGVGIEEFQARFQFKVQGDQVDVEISPSVRARVLEVRGGYPLRDKGPRPIARNLESEINRQVLAVTSFLQEIGSDALGFGEMLRRSDPKAWERLESRWGEIFPTVKVQVRSSAEITSTAMLTKFFTINEGK